MAVLVVCTRVEHVGFVSIAEFTLLDLHTIVRVNVAHVHRVYLPSEPVRRRIGTSYRATPCTSRRQGHRLLCCSLHHRIRGGAPTLSHVLNKYASHSDAGPSPQINEQASLSPVTWHSKNCGTYGSHLFVQRAVRRMVAHMNAEMSVSSS